MESSLSCWAKPVGGTINGWTVVQSLMGRRHFLARGSLANKLIDQPHELCGVSGSKILSCWVSDKMTMCMLWQQKMCLVLLAILWVR